MAREELPYGARTAMEPIGLTVRYSDDETGDICTEKRDEFESFRDEAVDFEATFDGEVIEVAITPHRAVRLKRVDVMLRHAFASDEMVLLNGFQSWTDTREMPPWERMRGMRGVPVALVKRWAIDGGGDYADIKYTGRRGEQHGYTYATFRRDEGMVLLGSLDETHGFTIIFANANTGMVALNAGCPKRVLAAGERVVVGRYAIVRGTVDECYDRWFELSGVQARPVRPLVGYTSWYRHYGDIDEAKLQSDLAGITPIGHPALQDLFQIDDGYCKVGDWLDIDKQKFPRGLKPLADEIRAAGFLPGLWVAPFVCEHDSRLFRECSDWLLRDEEGNPVKSGPQWSGGYALDVRNVEVRSYVLDVLRTMTQEWGFGLLKADFLYAACMKSHDGLNRGELMTDAMDLLRRGAGEDTLILGCGVPLGSAFGIVDYCRIGCDVGLDWNDKFHMRPLHRERVSTKHSLTSTLYREPLDGRAFGNDPDVFFLREDVKLTQAQRDKLIFSDADCGSVFLTSDDQAQWSDAARSRYEEALKVFISRHTGRREKERHG